MTAAEFERFYHGSQRLLWAMARQKADQPEDAEDMVQEVLLRVSRMAEPPGPACLRLLVRNAYVDVCWRPYTTGRHAKTYVGRPTVLQEELGEALPARASSVEDQVIARDTVREIGRTRPDVLYYALGYSTEETGQRFGISASTVKSHVFRLNHSREGGMAWRKYA